MPRLAALGAHYDDLVDPLGDTADNNADYLDDFEFKR